MSTFHHDDRPLADSKKTAGLFKVFAGTLFAAVPMIPPARKKEIAQ